MTAIETEAPAPGGGAPVTLPFTGAEYLESLRDGREVWIYGERVKDITAHPAFRNSARSVARLYDALHDPAQQAVLTSPTDTGNGGFTHSFFRVPHSADDLRSARDAIVGWQRLFYGYMGRTPTTRRRSSARSAPTRTSTPPTRTTPAPGTPRHRSASCT